MTSLNFPANPTLGQTHTVGEKTWAWNGVAWAVQRTSVVGKSAYDLAIENGFVGTKADWIASLKGLKGDTGIQGPKGDTGSAGPKGDPGDRGTDGINGIDGQDGVGVPTGGSTGQILAKNSDNPFDTEWVTPDYLSDYTVPLGGNQGQFLGKVTASDGDFTWLDIPEGSAGDPELPIGGNEGQVLTKNSTASGDVIWADPVGGAGLPDGGTAGQILIKNSEFNGDATWQNVPGAGDTLPDLTGNSGKVLKVNSDATAVIWADSEAGDGSAYFPDFTSNAGKMLVVNNAEDGVEWADSSISLTDAPEDGNLYGRKNAQWITIDETPFPTLTSNSGKVLAVNDTENTVEWINLPEAGTGLPAGGAFGNTIQQLGDGSAEWFDPISTGFSNSGGPPYGVHRYWRLRVDSLRNGGDTAVISEIEFHSTVGGLDITGNGGAGISSGGNASLAFDNGSNSWGASGVQSGTCWIGYDFGDVEVSVVEVAITTNDSLSVDVNNVTYGITVQYSNDGVSWNTAWSFNQNGRVGTYTSPITVAPATKAYLVPTGGDLNQVLAKNSSSSGDFKWVTSSPVLEAPQDGNYYARKDSGWAMFDPDANAGDTLRYVAYRFWRIYVTATQQGSLRLNELQLRNEAGIDQCSNGLALGTMGGPQAAFDDNGTTYIDSNVPAGIGYNFSVPVKVYSITLTSAVDVFADRAPWDFSLQYSTDGVTWFDWQVFSNRAPWGSSQTTRVFNVDPQEVAGNRNPRIFDLADVDLNTTPPTTGQTLVWNNELSVWQAGNISSGGGDSGSGSGGSLPTGGTTGQYLAKISDTDGDANWQDLPESTTLPALTSNSGKVLAVNSTEDNVEWITPASGGGTSGSAARQFTVTEHSDESGSNWSTKGNVFSPVINIIVDAIVPTTSEVVSSTYQVGIYELNSSNAITKVIARKNYTATAATAIVRRYVDLDSEVVLVAGTRYAITHTCTSGTSTTPSGLCNTSALDLGGPTSYSGYVAFASNAPAVGLTAGDSGNGLYCIGFTWRDPQSGVDGQMVNALSLLSDVDITTVPPVNGQYLAYNTTTGKFVPGGSVGNNSLPDPTVAPGQSLRSKLDGTGYELVNNPSVGPAVFGSHRYWAFFPTGWQGTTDPGNFTTIHEIQFRGTPGGARIVGGTPRASSTYSTDNPVSKAFDGSNSTYWESNNEAAGVGYIGYDFGASNLVSINEISITVGTDYPGERPTRGYVAWSDNGTVWNTAWEIPKWTFSSQTATSSVVLTNPRYAANVVPSVGAVGVTTISTDAAATLTFGSTKSTVRHTGTLTADRTLTLSTVAQEGAKFRVTRTGSGAFNLSVGGLKNLVQNSWCDVEWNAGTNAWILTAAGTL